MDAEKEGISKSVPLIKKKYGYVYGRSYKEVKEKLLKVRVAREQERIGGIESNATFAFYSAKWFSSLSPYIKESTKNKYQDSLIDALKLDLI